MKVHLMMVAILATYLLHPVCSARIQRENRQTSADQMVQNILNWLQGAYTQNSRTVRQGTLREYLPPVNTQKPRPFEPLPSDGPYAPAGITPQPPFPVYTNPVTGAVTGEGYPSPDNEISPPQSVPNFNGYAETPSSELQPASHVTESATTAVAAGAGPESTPQPMEPFPTHPAPTGNPSAVEPSSQTSEPSHPEATPEQEATPAPEGDAHVDGATPGVGGNAEVEATHEPEATPGQEATPAPEGIPGQEATPAHEEVPGQEATPAPKGDAHVDGATPGVGGNAEVEATHEPEVTPGQEATPAPEGIPGQEATPAPEGDAHVDGATPGVGGNAEVDATHGPEATPGQEATPAPEGTSGHEFTSGPEVSAGQEATPAPEAIPGQEATVAPEGTLNQEVTLGSETTPGEEASAAPEATAGQEGIASTEAPLEPKEILAQEEATQEPNLTTQVPSAFTSSPSSVIDKEENTIPTGKTVESPEPDTNTTATAAVDDDLHPPHIHDINVQCAKDMMTINIEFNRQFDGVIYSKGFFHMPECRYVQENSGQTKYTFTVSLNSCGTEFVNALDTEGQSYLENILVLQNEPGIQEAWDTVRAVRCLWEGNLKDTLSVALSVGMLSQEILTFSGDSAMAKLDINLGRGPFGQPASGLVKIGEPMTLVVSVSGDPGFDLQVKDCRATDSSGQNTIQLTDDDGCVLKTKLFGAFQKTRNTGDTGASIIAYAYFNAFKFPDVMDLMIECNIELCKTDCDMCPTQDQKLEPGARRRRRRDLYASNETVSDGVKMGKHIRVFLPEDIAQDAIALRETDDVCMSIRTFALSTVVLIALLILSYVMTVYLWLKSNRVYAAKL